MRRRLIAVSAAVTTMVAIAFLVPLAILTSDLAADRERAAAERDAESVARLIVLVPDSGGQLSIEDLVPPSGEEGRQLSIIGADGTVVGTPLSDGEDLSPAFAGATFRRAVPGGEAVYVPVVTSEGTFVVRALATDEAMSRGVVRTWVILLLVGVALVFIAIAVSDRLGRSIVRSVEDLSDAAGRLGAGDLDTRVVPDGPSEIEDVGRAFNRLAVQVEELLQGEREQVADLAHRLRTPLTAARLNAEAMPDDERRTTILEQLDELQRVVDHIISEARRIDRRTTDIQSDVVSVAEGRAAFWEPLASDEGRKMRVDVDEGPIIVAAPAADLSATLDALIGNVFAHTEAGVGFRLIVHRHGSDVEVAVEDEGEGFPVGVDVMTRGASGGESTGLGLDIANRTAETAGGICVLDVAPGGGGAVILRIPVVDT
jgi:signal transduction histidine kinase